MWPIKFVNKYGKDANRIKEIKWGDSWIPWVDAKPYEKVYGYPEDTKDPMGKPMAQKMWKMMAKKKVMMKK